MKALPRPLVTLTGVLALATLFGLHAHSAQQRAALESLRSELRQHERSLEVNLLHRTSTHEALDGSPIAIGYSSRGIELVFFLPTCPACQRAASGWQRKATRLASQGIEFVAVASASEGLEDFVARFQLELPVIRDTDSRLAEEFGIQSYPSSIFLDRRGKVRLRDTGVLAQDFKRSSLAAACRELPTQTQEGLVAALVASLDPSVSQVTSVQLAAGAEPVFVLENEGGLRGFAALLSREVMRTASSNLECLVLLDVAGEFRALLPLIEHVADGREVAREELEAWARPSALQPGRITPLRQTLLAELNALRAQFDLAPAVTGVALADS